MSEYSIETLHSVWSDIYVIVPKWFNEKVQCKRLVDVIILAPNPFILHRNVFLLPDITPRNIQNMPFMCIECIQPRRRTRGKHYECGLIEWQGTGCEQGQMWLVASERGKPTNQPASSQPYSNSFVAATRNSPFKFHFCFTSSPWFGCVWLGHHSSAFYQSENHTNSHTYLVQFSSFTQITTLSSPRPTFCRHRGTVRPTLDTNTA